MHGHREMLKGRGSMQLKSTHRFGGHNWVKVIKGAVNAWVLLIEVGIDCLLQYAERVVRPLVQVGPHPLEHIVCDIVEGVLCEHRCAHINSQALACEQKPDALEGIIVSCGRGTHAASKRI